MTAVRVSASSQDQSHCVLSLIKQGFGQSNVSSNYDDFLQLPTGKGPMQVTSNTTGKVGFPLSPL